jgi:hypothetical protein
MGSMREQQPATSSALPFPSVTDSASVTVHSSPGSPRELGLRARLKSPAQNHSLICPVAIDERELAGSGEADIEQRALLVLTLLTTGTSGTRQRFTEATKTALNSSPFTRCMVARLSSPSGVALNRWLAYEGSKA